MSNQYGTGIFQNPIYQQYQTQEDALNEQRAKLSETLSAPSGPSGQDTMLAAVQAMIPMLAGLAIAKKQGGALGAQAGAQASQQYLANASKKGEMAKEKAKLQMSGLDKKLDSIGSSKDALMKAAYTTEATHAGQSRLQEDSQKEEREVGIPARMRNAQIGAAGANNEAIAKEMQWLDKKFSGDPTYTKAREALNGSNNALGLLSNPDGVTDAMAVRMIAMSVNSGALSDEDVKGVLPENLKQQLVKFVNYVHNQENPTITEEQRKGLFKALTIVRQTNLNRITSFADQVSAIAGDVAPSGRGGANERIIGAYRSSAMADANKEHKFIPKPMTEEGERAEKKADKISKIFSEVLPEFENWTGRVIEVEGKKYFEKAGQWVDGATGQVKTWSTE